MVHFTTLSVSDTAAVNGITTNESRIVKDLEGGGRDLIEILSPNLTGTTEEIQRIYQQPMTRLRIELS